MAYEPATESNQQEGDYTYKHLVLVVVWPA